MTRPGITEGVLVALAGAVGAGATWNLLLVALPVAPAARTLVSLLAGSYLLYLLARSGLRVGRVSAVLAWCLMSALLAVLDPPFAVHVAAHATALWLVRSLAFHRGALVALADAGLLALGIAAAFWALLHTHSVAMAAWCLLLLQAFFTRLPPDLRGSRPETTPEDPDPRFERAHHAAETALTRLATHR